MTANPPQDPWNAPPPHAAQTDSPISAYSSDAHKGAPEAPELAGWWYRVGATVIDDIVLGIANLVVHLVLGRLIGYGIGIGINLAYLTVLIGGGGQTLGCLAVGTKVVAVDGSSKVGFRKALIRCITPYILLILLILPVVVDAFLPLWDRQKQTIHDKAAGTLVVRTRI